jgi:hypothetical protein
MRVNPSTVLVFRVNGRVVNHCKYFPYLGSQVITEGGALDYVHTHIKKVNGAFIKLYPDWRNKHTLLRTKICLFIINVKSAYSTGVEHEIKRNG